ncbi:MAG: rhodanese-like domain-containing protein, partial [Planctomycetota bacterium JB042]
PIFHLGPGGMEPNPEFLAVVKANVDPATPLVVGCKMGGRSARACEILAGEGYALLHNIDGGFGGRPDAPHESSRKGWAGSGLPTVTDSPGTYETLKSKA